MTPARPVVQEAAFVDAAGGPRLRIVTQPAEGRCLGTVVWVHAFAEEMNKTRRMSARMARLLAAAGWRVVQKDLAGCGDSAGDFSDASWAAWTEDAAEELRRADADRPVWLWCVRAGALLVPDLLAGRPHVNLLLWHPVVSGAQHLQQFLRLHVGARVLGSAKGASGSTPAQALREGMATEVGGYLIAPALAQALERASFDLPADHAGRIAWLELWPDEVPTVSPAAARVAERLKARGVDLVIEALSGPAFWQTQEVEESEELLHRSLLALARQAPAPEATAGAAPVDGGAAPAAGDAPSPEQALGFRCGDAQLWGVLTRPQPPAIESPTAVVIAVGGPQYRVGSHRQFVQLGRRLAEQGHPTLRFDYRGMGDSEGALRGFEEVGPDLHAAVDALRRACPAAREVVVWGLCDAASAAMMHAVSHAAVSGIVAVNPWARSDASLAAVQVKHYYLSRLLQREFWAKLARGRLDVRASIEAFLGNLRQGWRHACAVRSRGRDDSYQARMARGIAGFSGRMLLILAGDDLTAKEFLQHAGASPPWRGLLSSSRVSRVDVPQADHTFSSRVWAVQAEDATIAWLRQERSGVEPVREPVRLGTAPP